MPSPVDSGIGADMSLIASNKEDFYPGELLHGIEQRQERALSHRDSPIVIPKLCVRSRLCTLIGYP
jgi:hypothetical protein